MNDYYTGYIPFEEELLELKRPKGKSFELCFLTPHLLRKNHNKFELAIRTNNLSNAYKTADLLLSSFCMYYSCDFDHPDTFPIILETDTKEIHPFNSLPIYEMLGGIPAACNIATAASFRNSLTYCLHKFRTASTLFPTISYVLDPSESPYIKLSKYVPSDSIKMGYAIVLYYSILEELGVQINASAKNPSLIGDTWNPKVKSDLEERLKRRNIDISKPISWHRRSTPSKIEKQKKPLRIIKRSNWAYDYVRDAEIELIDAIRIVSWIRSSVVSHKVNPAIRSISIFDVANAKYLSRRLFLESIGLLNSFI